MSERPEIGRAAKALAMVISVVILAVLTPLVVGLVVRLWGWALP